MFGRNSLAFYWPRQQKHSFPLAGGIANSTPSYLIIYYSCVAWNLYDTSNKPINFYILAIILQHWSNEVIFLLNRIS
jgi:hypothetical protein